MTPGASPWWQQGVHLATVFAPLLGVAGSCVAILVPIWRGFGTGIWSGLKWCGRTLNPMHAVSRKVDQQSADIAAIRKILEPNGGSSICDRVNQILNVQTTSSAQLIALLEDAPTLRWGSSADGKQLWATGALIAITERSASDLENWGWVNVLDDLDRMAVIEAWAEARERGHDFDRHCHFVSRTGKRYAGRLIARPVNRKDPNSEWLGMAVEVVEITATTA